MRDRLRVGAAAVRTTRARRGVRVARPRDDVDAVFGPETVDLHYFSERLDEAMAQLGQGILGQSDGIAPPPSSQSEPAPHRRKVAPVTTQPVHQNQRPMAIIGHRLDRAMAGGEQGEPKQWRTGQIGPNIRVHRLNRTRQAPTRSPNPSTEDIPDRRPRDDRGSLGGGIGVGLRIDRCLAG